MHVALPMKKKGGVFQCRITSSKSFSPFIHQVSHNLSLYIPLYEDQLPLPLLHIYKYIVTLNGSIYIWGTRYYQLHSFVWTLRQHYKACWRLIALPWQRLLHFCLSANNRENVPPLKKILTQLDAGNNRDIRGCSYTDTSNIIHVGA